MVNSTSILIFKKPYDLMSPGWSWVNRTGNPTDTLAILNFMWSLSIARERVSIYLAESEVWMIP